MVRAPLFLVLAMGDDAVVQTPLDGRVVVGKGCYGGSPWSHSSLEIGISGTGHCEAMETHENRLLARFGMMSLLATLFWAVPFRTSSFMAGHIFEICVCAVDWSIPFPTGILCAK